MQKSAYQERQLVQFHIVQKEKLKLHTVMYGDTRKLNRLPFLVVIYEEL